MCFACKLSWQQPSLWHPREQQGAQSHQEKPLTVRGQAPANSAAAAKRRAQGEWQRRRRGLCPHLSVTAAELFLWTWGCFLGVSGDKSRVAGAHRASAWVFLRRKELTDLCCGSPGGRGSERGARGEEREAAAWRGAARERTWDYGLCPAQWRRLDSPGSDSTGALTPAWGQSAASPSLMGMLMWALSRGVLWPSRSTSTYGEGGHGSRGHSASPSAPQEGQHGLVCTGPSVGLGPRGGEPLLCRYPALLGSHPGPCPHSLTLSPALVPTGDVP